ncbi:host-nuclease inhibitor Gam family protein [Ohtaekwangia kribbensis]|uniref:Host-nuclease inhibitor Gam family protein n=1 Tax=Ohtaekwangia kribbensis TaxID=688913 RepID=A0ABW3JWZ7_9BACT
MQTKTKTLTPEKAAKELAEKKEFEKDLKLAEQLMTAYAEFSKEKEAIEAEKAEKIKPITEEYNEKLSPIMVSMKESETKLQEIGKKHKKKFVKNKLELTDGYILLSLKTIAVTGKNFVLDKFVKNFPQFVDVKFNIKELSKAFTDGDERKKVASMDIDLKKEESFQIKI